MYALSPDFDPCPKKKWVPSLVLPEFHGTIHLLNTSTPICEKNGKKRKLPEVRTY